MAMDQRIYGGTIYLASTFRHFSEAGEREQHEQPQSERRLVEIEEWSTPIRYRINVPLRKVNLRSIAGETSDRCAPGRKQFKNRTG